MALVVKTAEGRLILSNAPGPDLLPLAEWLETRPQGVGVVLGPDQDLAAWDGIEDDLKTLPVVALTFPAYTDGRAYSQARLLRDRYGYAGQLRAVGDVLLDQLRHMARVGFDAFETAVPVKDAQAALDRFEYVYQSAADAAAPVSALRLRRAARASAAK